MEQKLKKQLVKSATAVKRKVDMIRDVKTANNLALETIFKPIVDPLNQLANKENQEEEESRLSQIQNSKHFKRGISPSSSEVSEDQMSAEENFDNEAFRSNKTLIMPPSKENSVSGNNSFQSIPSSPVDSHDTLSWSTSSEVMKDVPFGVRNERGKLMLGKTRVYDNGLIIKIGNRHFKITPGLKDLLYNRTPDLELITQKDLDNYKLILIDTNAHRRYFDPSKPINSNKGFKYMHIIKPLFKFSKNTTSSMESLPRGQGIKLLKKVKRNTDYIYWDDPNELVERLKLLLASRQAGNTGLDNEIIEIINELHESDIINVEYKKHASGKLSSILTVNNERGAQ